MQRILCLLPAVALVALGTSSPNAARKCGRQQVIAGPGRIVPLMSIDGVVIQPGTVHPMSNVVGTDIYSVDIICMDAKDSTFNRTQGVAIISVWTKSGPAPRVTEALDVIRQAQDSSFARNGRYISAVSEIRFPENMKPVQMTLEAGPKGWVARTTLPRFLQTCMMFDGTLAAQPAGAPRKAACQREY